MADISMRGAFHKVDRGLWCMKLDSPIDGRFRDCELYEADKVRVRQYRWKMTGSSKSKTGLHFRVCVSSCANCLHAVNSKDVHR